MAEPTCEELKARLAALESQKAGTLQFKVSEKGVSAHMGWAALLLRFTMSNGPAVG